MSPVNPGFARSAGQRSVALATLCLLLWSPQVRAEPAAGRQSASDRATTAEARRHFLQGRVFLDAGNYAEAIAEFETALSLKPSPELLFNIAQAYRLKGDAKQALETYKRFIELSPDGPIADEARGHIGALSRQMEEEDLARDAERKRQEAERKRQDAERQRQDAERQHQDAERQRQDAERERYEIERDKQAHRQRYGVIAVGVGLALIVGGSIVVGKFGSGDPDHFNTADNVGVSTILAGVGLFAVGTITVILNPDLGSFRPTPAISKGVAYTFSF